MSYRLNLKSGSRALKILRPAFVSLFTLLCGSTYAQSYDSLYRAMDNAPWSIRFNDECRAQCPDNWQDVWHLDGDRARIERDEEGMTLYTGDRDKENADHAVLWTKKSFKGDIKIEYDFTRIDSSDANTVNILYIQATGSGKGEYAKDIMAWNALRGVPAMWLYYNNMNAYHISYAASGRPGSGESKRYIRGRRYNATTLKGTELTPEYLNVDLFEPGVKHHVSLIKRGNQVVMRVTAQGKDMTFYFDGSRFDPITEGRVGFRQMFTRVSRYDDIKIYGLD